MKLFILACIVLCASIQSTLAQPPEILWSEVIGYSGYDVANGVCQTSDGDYVVVGISSPTGIANYDILAVRLTAMGDTLWTRKFGGSSYETARAVEATSDGGCLIAGTTQSYGAGSSDMWLLRLTSGGDTLWTRTYGRGGNDQAYHVLPLSDGGFLISGYAVIVGGQMDAYFVRLTANGDSLWTRCYGGTGGPEIAVSTCGLSDGGFISVGYTQITAQAARDFYAIRMSSNGDTLWTRTYGGVAAEEAVGVAATVDGGFAIAGWTQSFGAGSHDYYLVITDGAGNPVSSRTYGSPGNERAYGFTGTYDGGFAIIGSSDRYGHGSTDLYLLKLSMSGDSLYARAEGGLREEVGNAIDVTSDGGLILAGSTLSYGAGNLDYYVLRMPGYSGVMGTVREVASGQPIPGVFVAAAGEAARSITDSQGRYTLTLMPGLHTIVTLGPCVSLDTVARNVVVLEDSLHALDIVTGIPVAEVTQTSINVMVNDGVARGDTLTIRNVGTGMLEFRVTSSFIAPDTAWFAPQPDHGLVPPDCTMCVIIDVMRDSVGAGTLDYFGVLELHTNSCPDSAKRVFVSASVLDAESETAPLPEVYALESYPNPFNATATLEYALPRETRVTLTLYDVTGRQVAELAGGVQAAGVHRLRFDASELSSGVYFARLEGSEVTLSKKLVLIK